MSDLTMAQMRAELARQVADAGGVTAFASDHRVPHALVSWSLRGKRPVSPAIANACGFFHERVTVFRKIGEDDAVG